MSKKLPKRFCLSSGPTIWSVSRDEFLVANKDAIDADLSAGRDHHLGGGAAPLTTIMYR